MTRLRPLQRENFIQVLKWAESKDFSEFFRRFPPLCDWASWERAQPLLSAIWAIVDEDEVVGLASLGNYDFHARSNEVGMLIDSPKRGQLAFEVGMQLCEYAFDYLGNNKVTTRVLKHRVKLAGRLGLCGFKQEGILREACLGQDEILLSCLKSEYKRVEI